VKDTQSQTESLIEIIKGIRDQTIMLPEFQRDFRWEMEQTYDLFDSLVRDIFIGTVIYGKPSFGMTLREIDQRPRKGKGSNAKLKTIDLSTEEISARAQTQNLRIVLDGQQRITSIYRAIVGLDSVYLILHRDLDPIAINELSLESLVDSIAGEESDSAISVKLSDAYETEIKGLDDDDLNRIFSKTLFSKHRLIAADEAERKSAEKIYRRAIRKLIDLYKQQKMVAFYLLDMNLEKFCVFFERSNSRGIQLNFTDILAAKLYRGFNLRKKIEEFESQSKLKLNREIIVRAIAYTCGVERGGTISIDKKFILEHLDAIDFQNHWDSICSLYTESLQYLTSQHYILSQEWMPFENMVIPLMMFRKQVKGFDQMNQDQRLFLEYWYWASIFANRYSSASNEVIIADCGVLSQVARSERITTRGYFAKLRPLVTEPEDLFSYTKKTSAIYRGVLNLLGYSAQGLKDWNSTHKIDVTMRLEDHHIYPRAYIASSPDLDLDQNEAEQLVDCVANRTLIPKILNIRIGKKAPQVYLSELQQKVNSDLPACLPGHLIPADMLSESTWNGSFKTFLEIRSGAIFALIDQYVIVTATDMLARFGPQSDVHEPAPLKGKARLKDMFANGRVKRGDRVFVRKQPEKYAILINGEIVEFEGKQMSINAWGQQMTGWSSINIYDQVVLERIGQPLNSLRDEVESDEAPK
jgi:hypothetical protein